MHMASKAETCHPLRTNWRWKHVLLLPCLSSNMASDTAILSGVKEPMKDSPKPELLKQYCVTFARPVFHKDPNVTLKTVGMRLEKIFDQTDLSRAERSFLMEENCNH